MKNLKFKININDGFTLGMTMMVSSMVLLLSFSIFSIMYREIKVTNIGNDSATAYYNADLGIECVKYYEDKNQRSNPNSAASKVLYNGAIIPSPHTLSGFFLGSEYGSQGGVVVDPANGLLYQPTNSYLEDIKCGGMTITKNTLNANNLGANAKYNCNIITTLPVMVNKFSINNTTLDICVDIEVSKTYKNSSILEITSTGYNSCNAVNGRRVSRVVSYKRGIPAVAQRNTGERDIFNDPTGICVFNIPNIPL